jgi:1-deoxy-D-xylulose-5-phosphate reductoisomerase
MTHPQNIAILGSTGSIGKSSLEVIANFPDAFRVTYLTVNTNVDGLLDQVRRFRPRGVVVLDQHAAARCRQELDGTTEILCGEEGLIDIVQRDDVDTVISSLVGFAGLKPTVKAIEARKKIALANKETLVVAGEIVMDLVRKYGVELLPVDSEHSAIFQCLVGESSDQINKIILTASGGPFRTKTAEELRHVGVQHALNHPNWKMGSKITIDSASMMNKGLEVIEARWLFDVPADRIEIVVHPQSIIHSMVEFIDGSVKAQLGVPDMKIPIQYALTYPNRCQSAFDRVKFPSLQTMTFFEPDAELFPALGLAYSALDAAGTMPAAMNAANEIAVALFLAERIRFVQIPEIIADTMAHHTNTLHPSLDEIREADAWARRFAADLAYVKG